MNIKKIYDSNSNRRSIRDNDVTNQSSHTPTDYFYFEDAEEALEWIYNNVDKEGIPEEVFEAEAEVLAEDGISSQIVSDPYILFRGYYNSDRYYILGEEGAKSWGWDETKEDLTEWFINFVDSGYKLRYVDYENDLILLAE